jgi:hypothetical protein
MSFEPSESVVDLAVVQLLAMLRYKRPFGSKEEDAFIERFIDPLEPQVVASNRVIVVPRPDGSDSRTLFSCHTDTVHRTGGKQKVVYDPQLDIIYKDDGLPLGADDGAGVWIMLQMIRHGVPGTYVFHTGEEVGGIGSSLMADTEPEFLQGFDRAIAFDRKGTQDVITEQMPGTCCSTKFAKALAAALNDAQPEFSYEPCARGIFTDTANYIDLIPECTNISVGYEGEHTGGEMIDVGHLTMLAEAVVKIDWDALPTHRDPKAEREQNRWWKDSDYDWCKEAYKDAWDKEDGADLPSMEDRYKEADEMAYELFSTLYECGLNRAYEALRHDEVVDFYLEDPRGFKYMLEGLQAFDFDEGDDNGVISWVRGY